ncbi:MAG: ATP-binding protein [Planctomycetota bacterium]
MRSKAPISHSVVIRSVPSVFEGVCREILSELEGRDFEKEDVFAVRLALQEAFLNAMRHGNKMDVNKRVRIDYTVALDKVEVSLTDDGEGFDPEIVPDPRCGDNLYKTDGRGIFLIRSYMDAVRFNEQGNSVCMVRYRQGKRQRRTEGLVSG